MAQRQSRAAALPLNQRPRTRTVVSALGIPLVALQPNYAAPPRPQALAAPAFSVDLSVSTFDLGARGYANDAEPGHVEHVFRGRTTFITRAEWEDPAFRAGLRRAEDEIRARERRERLRRAREGGRGRRARRAAFRGGERLRVRGRFVTRWQWQVDVWNNQ